MQAWMRNLTLAGATLGFMAGCAHAPPPAPTETVSNHTTAPEAKPVAYTPPPKPANTDKADLEALLRGDIIHFDYDAATLTSESRDRLQKLAEALRQHPDLAIKISGNCDERGTEEYNLALGQRRAEVAKKYLADLGIGADRVKTISYGKEKPLVEGHDESSWSQNRRDDIAINGQ